MIFIRGAKRFSQPPQPPEPFTFFHNQRLVSSLNPQDVVGPAARHFVCFVYFVVKKSVYSVYSVVFFSWY